MSSQNDSGFATFQASGAISAYKAVALQSDGTITPAAGNGALGIGILQEDAADAGYARVKLWTAPGTFMIMATNTAITPATTYAIVTGGFAGVVNGTFAPASLIGLQSGVASSGIIVEFLSTL